MKSLVATLLIVGVTLSLSAIEIEDTFDEWDIVINGCISTMTRYRSPLEGKPRRITEKVRKGKKLTCQEKIILVLETQKLVRGILERAKTNKVDIDKEVIAWQMVHHEDDLKVILEELLKETKRGETKRKAEIESYFLRLTEVLKQFFPECYPEG